MTDSQAGDGRVPGAAILINNYNNGAWLRCCVDSALAQDQPAAEVIVYDDGSTDESVDILRSYGSAIRPILGARGSATVPTLQRQARAIHAAFLASTAEQVHLLDGDDAYLPGRLRAYAQAWARTPAAVLVQAPMIYIDSDGRQTGFSRQANRHRVDFDRAYYDLGDTDLFYPTSALAFHRSYLEKRLPLDFSDGINVASDLRLSLPSPWCGPVLTLEAPHSCYRVRPASLSQQNGARDAHGSLLLRRRYFNRIAPEFGKPPLPLWKNQAFWRGEFRRRLPRGLAERIARILADRKRRELSQ